LTVWFELMSSLRFQVGNDIMHCWVQMSSDELRLSLKLEPPVPCVEFERCASYILANQQVDRDVISVSGPSLDRDRLV